MWQDTVISLGNMVFAGSLLFSVFSDQKPNKYTSMSTAFVLFVFMVTFISLDMTYSAFMSYFNGMLWAILFFQRLSSERREKRDTINLISY